MRLREYDYTGAGAYFVTICTHNRECLFGEIADKEMKLNDAGRMVEKWWVELMKKFPSVKTDAHIVMPNHFHGIIVIVGATLCGRPDESCNQKKGNHIGLPLQVSKQKIRQQAQPTLGNIVDWFKTMVANEYIRGIKQFNWPPFPGKLWQRNYYEHIVRDEDELNRTREYTENNPMQWELDQENPDGEEQTDFMGRGDPAWSP